MDIIDFLRRSFGTPGTPVKYFFHILKQNRVKRVHGVNLLENIKNWRIWLLDFWKRSNFEPIWVWHFEFPAKLYNKLHLQIDKTKLGRSRSSNDKNRLNLGRWVAMYGVLATTFPGYTSFKEGLGSIIRWLIRIPCACMNFQSKHLKRT